jgi:uncharacterized membrane protein YccC
VKRLRRASLDVLIASDPGLTRARSAARATLTAAASTLALVPVARARHEPATLLLAGIVVGTMAAARVYDNSLGARRVTMSLAIPVALVTVGAGSMAASRPWLDQVLLCVVAFAATFARRYGPRGSTLGLLAFMSYFFSLFAHTGENDFAMASIAIAISVALAYVVTFGVVRDAPDRLLDGLLVAFRARAASVLDSLAVMVSARTPLWWRRHRARVTLARLNDAALALEDEAEARTHRSAVVDHWALDVFEVELAVETVADVVDAARRGRAPAGDRAHIAAGIAALGALVREPPAAEPAPCADDHPLPRAVARPLRFSRRILERHHPWRAPNPADAVLDEAVTAAGGVTPLGPNPDATATRRTAIKPTLRLAIQAAIAAALATIAGHPVSSARWYWAVVGAFVVFMRATNRAESLSRAWQRILGTVGGVVLGVAVAQIVGRDQPAALVLLFASVFGAFYFSGLSYAWMIVFFTTALALLYDTIGNYSSALLGVRLEETLIGAAIGAIVASVVLPAPARISVDRRAADLLREADRAVSALTAPDAASMPPRVRLRWARGVDRAVQRLRQSTSPAWEINVPLRVPPYMESVRAAVELAYAVRHLVARSGVAAGDQADVAVQAAPVAQWLARIAAARTALAAAAGLAPPLAGTARHAEIA